MFRSKNAFLFVFLLLILISCGPNPSTTSTQTDAPVKINPAHIVGPDKLNNPYAQVDVSPMDMSYFPPNYPQLKMAGQEAAKPVMRLIYSRPHLQGRTLFKDMLHYGETWRLGANEATELHVFQTVTIGNKKLTEGRYSLYAIPQQDHWTIAINRDLDNWGLKQDSTKDIVRVDVPITHDKPSLEYFTMVFEKSPIGANLIMAWQDVVAKLPIQF